MSRRLLSAMLSLLLFHLSMASGAFACPLRDGGSHSTAPQAQGEMAHHAEHQPAIPDGDDAAAGGGHQHDASRSAGCLGLSACAMTVIVPRGADLAASRAPALRIAASAEREPRSAVASPELPPPRR